MFTSIPAFHVSSPGKVKGSGEVFIQSRQDAASSGTFSVKLEAHFDPAVDAYPIASSLRIKVDMSDGAKGVFNASSVELINSFGKHSPTIFLTGTCKADIQPNAIGCRYWLMIANNRRDNQGTPDVVSFAIHNNKGDRIAYGTGPLKTGDFTVEPA